MQNEIILITTLLITYLGVLTFYKFLGKTGLYVWTAIATICANIEVLILIDAFNMEQTLGNILFASTFLATDLLSEYEGKEFANKAVKVGIFTSISFILISQSWFLYVPNANDFATPAIKSIFSNTPRLMIVGILVYAISQAFDVWFYHYIWDFTTQKFGNSSKFLWLRNNLSTLVSLLFNTILFTFGAFFGTFPQETLIDICIASYIIFIITSLLDTPILYLYKFTNKQNTKEI
ncbi:MAG: queuosine precursor transporter [Clostridia bacterium]